MRSRVAEFVREVANGDVPAHKLAKNDISTAKSERNRTLLFRGATEVPGLLQCTISGVAGHAPWQREWAPSLLIQRESEHRAALPVKLATTRPSSWQLTVSFTCHLLPAQHWHTVRQLSCLGSETSLRGLPCRSTHGRAGIPALCGRTGCSCRQVNNPGDEARRYDLQILILIGVRVGSARGTRGRNVPSAAIPGHHHIRHGTSPSCRCGLAILFRGGVVAQVGHLGNVELDALALALMFGAPFRPLSRSGSA